MMYWPRAGRAWASAKKSGQNVPTNCMGKASRGVALHKCMLDATDLAYLPVVLEIPIYAAIYSVLCAAPGLKPLWLPPFRSYILY